MQTQILTINDIEKDKHAIERAAKYLLSGELVAFPTETVYGLGANGLDAKASQKIYQAKSRPSDNPLILHVASLAMLSELGKITKIAEKILRAFSPGPLTVILEKTDKVPLSVTGGRTTVALRFPKNDIALALIQEAHVPIAAPSANISGRPSPTSSEMVKNDLDGKIPLILDGGKTMIGVESTIVDCRGTQGIILRPGGITSEELKKIIPLAEDTLLTDKDLPIAPGMKYRHYAPHAQVILIEESANIEEQIYEEIVKLSQVASKIGLFISEETHKYLLTKKIYCTHPCIITYGKRTDTAKIAHILYQSLVDFDKEKVDYIITEGIAENKLGIAIMNRLKKAASNNA